MLKLLLPFLLRTRHLLVEQLMASGICLHTRKRGNEQTRGSGLKRRNRELAIGSYKANSDFFRFASTQHVNKSAISSLSLARARRGRCVTTYSPNLSAVLFSSDILTQFSSAPSTSSSFVDGSSLQRAMSLADFGNTRSANSISGLAFSVELNSSAERRVFLKLARVDDGVTGRKIVAEQCVA